MKILSKLRSVGAKFSIIIKKAAPHPWWCCTQSALYIIIIQIS